MGRHPGSQPAGEGGRSNTGLPHLQVSAERTKGKGRRVSGHGEAVGVQVHAMGAKETSQPQLRTGIKPFCFVLSKMIGWR